MIRLLAFLCYVLFAAGVCAQTPAPQDQQKIDDLVRLLQDPAVRSWLDTRLQATPQSPNQLPADTNDLSGWESQTRARINGIISAIPSIPAEISAAALRARQDATSKGFAPVFVIFAGLVAAGLAVEWIYRRSRPTREGIVARLAPIAVFALGMSIIFFAITWPPLARVVLLAYLAAFVLYRLGAVLIDLSAANLSLRARAKIMLAIALFSIASAAVARPLAVAPPVSEALSYGFSVLILAIAVEATWSCLRRSLAIKAGLTAFLGVIWLFWCLDLKGLFWLGLYALILPGLLASVGRAVEATYPHDPKSMLNIFVVRGARAVVIALAAAWMTVVWQLNPDSLGHSNPIVSAVFYGLVKSVVVLLIADLLWQLMKNWINRTLEKSGEAAGLTAEEAARRGRFRTLLPIFRNVLAVMMVVMTGLAILSEFGVEIGPLIAGAGIFGIALGFGSQTLVKDVISGVFYMLDDAFRVGEYIQSKNYKGTVEGFSLRSVRLRHHRGPVFTVPFGELGAVENMSRDWSVIKFIISVGYDTDVPKVKSITKAIGKELGKDPEFEPVIIDNLKMKGVEKFGEYGIDLSFGMMLRPSPLQSTIRRKANLMLREAFKEHGISFATPSVQVGGDDRTGAAAAVTANRLQHAKIVADAEA